MAQVTITPIKNGPYRVTGPIRLTDPQGEDFSLEKETVALCRCGASSNKPFCDGTHRRIGFESDVEAR